jgi:hypothetical protein|tara:strand:- start:1384 stop:1923 length:540 start_codon:yes stop_codon:yes gene_type:complete
MVFLKRGSISSKQISGEEMADIKIKEVSKDDAFFMWNRDNPDDPFVRNLPSWYDLDNWVVRVNDGEVVGVAGYSDKGDYGILGGMKARSKDKPKGGGNWKALLEYRRDKLAGKPKILGLASSKIPQSTWVKMNRNAGFQTDDLMGIPEDVVDNFRQQYGDDWGISKSLSWRFYIMEGYF